MATFIDANGKEVEVNETVDIKEWKAAGFKEKGKRGRPATPGKEEQTKQQSQTSPKRGGGLIEEDV